MTEKLTSAVDEILRPFGYRAEFVESDEPELLDDEIKILNSETGDDSNLHIQVGAGYLILSEWNDETEEMTEHGRFEGRDCLKFPAFLASYFGEEK